MPRQNNKQLQCGYTAVYICCFIKRKTKQCAHTKNLSCVSNTNYLPKLDAAVGTSHKWQINFIDVCLLLGYNYCSRIYNHAYIKPIIIPIIPYRIPKLESAVPFISVFIAQMHIRQAAVVKFWQADHMLFVIVMCISIDIHPLKCRFIFSGNKKLTTKPTTSIFNKVTTTICSRSFS